MTNTIRAPEWPPDRVRALCKRLAVPLAEVARRIGCDVATLRGWRTPGGASPTALGYVARLRELDKEKE